MKNYGGSAVMNGVMFSDGENYSVAIRDFDGNIKSFTDKEHKFIPKKLNSLLFIRGLLIPFMLIGNVFKMKKTMKLLFGNKIKRFDLTFCIQLIAAMVFIYGISSLFSFLSEILITIIPQVPAILIKSILDVTFIVSYIYLGFKLFKPMQEIKQYHGAEHMVISCYENGEEINLDNVKKYDTVHPRCGTSFVVFVILVKITIINFLLSTSVANLLLFKFLVLPIMISLGYEISKLTNNNKGNIILNKIKQLGLNMQRLTTSKPTDEQLEVAIVSFNSLVEN